MTRIAIAATERIPDGPERVLQALRDPPAPVNLYTDAPTDPPHPRVDVIETEDPGTRMIEDLLEGRIDAAVRGAVPSHPVKELAEALDLPATGRSTVLETEEGLKLLTPVAIDEGHDVDELTELGLLAAEAHSRMTGGEPRIAVLSGGRLEDVGRHPTVDETLEKGENVAERLRREGLHADHVGILVEEALKTHDVLLFHDGIAGNLAFRCLVLAAGFPSHGAPCLWALKEGVVFVDTSRSQRPEGYSRALRLALSLAER
ncbi:MAG: methanogenesis marker protein Mmp4/MtxX [Methanopyri archaeon]|nr:methanogenesis marker protein Mmp4/MtxX [Methanopyri archaeon]